MSSSNHKKVYHIMLLLLVTFLIGTFLRLYQMDAFTIFLGDQGRDAIIMKRIVTFVHLPLVGASSSVGQVYLGPFYYYFMAPWLALYHFNPIGPAVGVALLSSLFIIMVYYGVSDLFNKRTAVIASILVAFSAVLIDLSRFSWNPNLLPMFSFIVFYLFIKALLTKEGKFFILTGVFLGFAFQLHYVTFSLLFAYGIASLFFLWKNAHIHKRSLGENIKKILLMIGSFLVISTPLVLFDLRHQFLNTKNFITLFQKPGSAGAPSLMSLIDGFSSLNKFALSLDIPLFGALLIFIGLLFSLKIWKDSEYRYLLSIFILSLFVTSFMTANKFPHYFGALYPLYYLIVAVVIDRCIKKGNKIAVISTAVVLFGFIYVQFLHYSFLYTKPNNQIAHGLTTAQKMYPLVTKERYRVTGIPDTTGTSMYSYFLELWGKTPVVNTTLEPADEMFVVCEQECAPVGNPQWDIAYFQPRQVETSLQSDNVFIYKLIK